jgi:hypothetical protein
MSFSTLYQFPLLSTQQQSVEMYDLARRQMDIDALFRDVDKEIDAADQMFAGLVDEAVTNSIHSLTKWGFPVAAMMLILTAFTLIHDSESGKALDTRSWLSMMWPWRWGYALDFLYLCVPFAVLWGLTSLVLWRRNRRS